jgi:hypothetical protein
MAVTGGSFSLVHPDQIALRLSQEVRSDLMQDKRGDAFLLSGASF